MNSPTPRTKEALAHLGWLRALAMGLARDASVAEDVVQEAYLLSMERPPRRASRLGPWLAKVTRTLARQEARSARARRERESIASELASGSESDEPSEVLERGRRQRRVVEAVMDLPEPYARAVLYHYLDGLSTGDVAQRMGCEAATVRKRLERARAMLRERLDREFGDETGSWALGLLLPLAPSRASAVATGAAGSGALSLLVNGLMGSKAIGLVGLVIVAALVVLNRGGFREEVEVSSAPLVVEQHVLALEETSGEEQRVPYSPVGSARKELAIPMATGEAHTVAIPDDLESGVLLHVRGLTPDGKEISTGRVDCFWSSKSSFPDAARQHHLERPIESPITTIQLPEDAQSVRVCVSHGSFAPSPGVTLDDLRADSIGGLQVGMLQRNVDVPLIARGDGPIPYSLHGDIYLDGALQCPPGLRITVGGRGQAWINTITSRYRFAPLTANPGWLLAVSDFSLPTHAKLNEEVQRTQQVNLELTSGRELLVHAVDASTGTAAVGREVAISLIAEVKQLGGISQRSHRQVATVDAAGNCRFRGIPITGRVSVFQELDDEVGRHVLKSIRLDPDSPHLVQCEVQLGSTETVTTRVFGRLPFPDGAPPSGTCEIRVHSYDGGEELTIPVSPNGSWSVELNSHQYWVLDPMLNGKPHARGKILELKGEAQLGPVQLGWWGEFAFTVHLVDVPLEGQVFLSCTELEGEEPQSFHLTAAGKDLKQVFKLRGPATIEISTGSTGSRSEYGVRQTLRVHPPTEREAIVDLRGSSALSPSLTINGAHPTGEGQLLLISQGSTRAEVTGVQFTIQHGQAAEPQVLAPGKWFYLFRHPEYPGAVLGLLELPPKASGPFPIHWVGSPQPSSGLGQGIRIQSIDGEDVPVLFPAVPHLPWDKDQLTEPQLWIPENMTFELID